MPPAPPPGAPAAIELSVSARSRSTSRSSCASSSCAFSSMISRRILSVFDARDGSAAALPVRMLFISCVSCCTCIFRMVTSLLPGVRCCPEVEAGALFRAAAACM